MGVRRIRRQQRQEDMKTSRRVNGKLKVKERARRNERVAGLIQAQGKLPYTPVVMSWLSQELNKPSRLITQDEDDRLLKKE